MPIIYTLNGIVFKMYFEQEEHNPPHVHAIYNDDASVIYIAGDRPSEGTLKHKQLVEAENFVAEHREILLEIWTKQDFSLLKEGDGNVS